MLVCVELHGPPMKGLKTLDIFLLFHNLNSHLRLFRYYLCFYIGCMTLRLDNREIRIPLSDNSKIIM